MASSGFLANEGLAFSCTDDFFIEPTDCFCDSRQGKLHHSISAVYLTSGSARGFQAGCEIFCVYRNDAAADNSACTLTYVPYINRDDWNVARQALLDNRWRSFVL